jgi:hypothetical protein
MKKLIDYGRDDHPGGAEEKVPSAWAVAVMDGREDCSDLRVELTIEEVGRAGCRQVAPLSPGLRSPGPAIASRPS